MSMNIQGKLIMFYGEGYKKIESFPIGEFFNDNNQCIIITYVDTEQGEACFKCDGKVIGKVFKHAAFK